MARGLETRVLGAVCSLFLGLSEGPGSTDSKKLSYGLFRLSQDWTSGQ